MKNKLLLAFIGSGLAAAYLGVKYRVPWVIGLLLGAAGLYGMFAGVRMIVSRRAEIPTSSGTSAHLEYHTGLAARLWGVLFLMFGTVAIALAWNVWFLPEGDGAFVRVIAASPLLSGSIISTAGLGVGFYGLTRLLAPRETFRETKLNRFEQIFRGVLFSFMGLAILSAGLVRMAAPGALTALRDLVYEWVANRFLR